MSKTEQTNQNTNEGAGAKPKINLNINISKSPLEKNKISADAEKKMYAMHPELFEQLKKHEQEIFSWLTKNTQNPYLLLTDPVKALQLAVPGMDPKLVKRIQEIRRNRKTHEIAMPDVDLNRLSIKVKAQ